MDTDIHIINTRRMPFG